MRNVQVSTVVVFHEVLLNGEVSSLSICDEKKLSFLLKKIILCKILLK